MLKGIYNVRNIWWFFYEIEIIYFDVWFCWWCGMFVEWYFCVSFCDRIFVNLNKFIVFNYRGILWCLDVKGNDNRIVGFDYDNSLGKKSLR